MNELTKHAENIVRTYLSAMSVEEALMLNNKSGIFPTGSEWHSSVSRTSEAAVQPAVKSDQVLANTILRMRDSMLHFEFQSAIADGDIGRAMNVMAVRHPVR